MAERPRNNTNLDALSAAFDHLEAGGDPGIIPALHGVEDAGTAEEAPLDEERNLEAPEDDGTGEPEKPEGERSRDSQGRFAKEQAERVAAEVAAKAAKEGAGDAQESADGKPAPKVAPVAGKAAPSAAGASGTALRAPASWRPLAKEAWGKIPVDAQKEILRREQEIQLGLQDASGPRKFAEAFDQLIGPYIPMIKSEGANPFQAIDALMQHATVLRTGTAPVRANLIADMIFNFGIDVPMLNDILVARFKGGQMPGQPGGRGGQPAGDPRVDKLLAELDDSKKRAEEAEIAKNAALIKTFADDPKHEFFEVVRKKMSLLVRAAKESGEDLTLQQAYDTACKMDPEIDAVLQARAKVAAAKGKLPSTQRAKVAAKSVRPSPAGTDTGAAAPKAKGRMGAIEAAWEELSDEE